MRPSTTVLLSAAAALALATPAGAATRLDDPIPAPLPASGLDVRVAPVATGLVAPTTGKAAPGYRHDLFVAEQNGAVWGIDLAHGDARWRVADLSDLLVSNLGKVIPGLAYDERGLLGLAFSPRFRSDRLVYTFTSENAATPADFTTGVHDGGQAVVTEWRMTRGPRPVIDRSSRRVLLRVDKPQFNHNGGDLAFGPDRLLYVSLGDGGAADDEGPGHVPGGNAQSLAPGNVLGKVLRIDPSGRSSANGQYGIPWDNPFVGRDGADEIFAYGFRNPYRFSFDGDRLYVGDVGQNDLEEVDLVTAGGNYGWHVKEGTFLFDTGGPTAPGFVTASSPGAPSGLVDPVLEYDHTAPGGVRCPGTTPATACQGIAVVGGFVYHGDDIRGLRGTYVFGDYSRAFAKPLGRLFVGVGGQVQTLPDPGIAVFGFAQDASGELYVLGNGTGVLSGTTGVVLRLTDGAVDDDQADRHGRDDGRDDRHGRGGPDDG
jgi:glucose/arabinose dehydrogenase